MLRALRVDVPGDPRRRVDGGEREDRREHERVVEPLRPELGPVGEEALGE